MRQVLIPLWNAWSFFSLYANAARRRRGVRRAQWSTASTDVLDRYLLAKLREFVETVQAQMDAYDIAGRLRLDALVPRRADELVHPALARPVLGRREDDGASHGGVRHALHRARGGTPRGRAPLLPLVTEEIWRGLTGGRSVHLDRLAGSPTTCPTDDALVAAMDRAREVCSTGSCAAQGREAAGAPAAAASSPSSPPTPRRCEPFAGDRRRRAQRQGRSPCSTSPTAHEADFGVSQRLVVNARAAGPRLGRDVQRAIKGSKSGDWSVADDGTVTSGGLALVEGEYALETVVDAGAGRAARDRRCCPAAASSCSTPT